MYKDPDFNFYTAYSREEPGNYDHLVRIGYVHQVYEEVVKAHMILMLRTPVSVAALQHFIFADGKEW